MIDGLFELMDSIKAKETAIDNVIKFFGGEEGNDFLWTDIKRVELLIVKALGGNEDIYNHIVSTDMFSDYRYGEHYSKEELIDYIKYAIENNVTHEVRHIIKRA